MFSPSFSRMPAYSSSGAYLLHCVNILVSQFCWALSHMITSRICIKCAHSLSTNLTVIWDIVVSIYRWLTLVSLCCSVHWELECEYCMSCVRIHELWHISDWWIWWIRRPLNSEVYVSAVCILCRQNTSSMHAYTFIHLAYSSTGLTVQGFVPWECLAPHGMEKCTSIVYLLSHTDFHIFYSMGVDNFGHSVCVHTNFINTDFSPVFLW